MLGNDNTMLRSEIVDWS